MKKIIYDVGANNGDDIPYYLMKGDRVVAIEANPVLCERIRLKFEPEIQAGRLVLESCVVTADVGLDEVDFYLHNSNHLLSQLPSPSPADTEHFTRLRLPAKSILKIIESYGAPYYIKIDIEHYEVPLLKAIFAGQYHPPFISAESHSIEVFIALAGQGGYNAFKLVDGPSVSNVYADRLIKSSSSLDPKRYSFPNLSAGPFGNDIDGPWMTAEHFFRLLAFEGLGWKDIHATNTETPDPTAQPRVVNHLDRLINRNELLSYVARRVKKSLFARLKWLGGSGFRANRNSTQKKREFAFD